MSKELTYESFLSSTCETHNWQLDFFFFRFRIFFFFGQLKLSDLVIEEADSEDVLVLGHPISHGQVSQRVPQQQHVGPTLQLLEVGCL